MSREFEEVTCVLRSANQRQKIRELATKAQNGDKAASLTLIRELARNSFGEE